MNTEALSILGMFETTKDQRRSFVDQVVQTVAEGHVDPLKVHLQIKCTEEMIKAIKSSKEYSEAVLDEASKHGKSFDYRNANLSIKEVGTKFDYSVCQDPEHTALQEAFDLAKAKLDERETFLKSLPASGQQVVNEETGETYKIYPPLKSSTTSVTVKLL